MIGRSIIVALLSFLIYFMPAYLLWYYEYSHKIGPSFLIETIIQFFVYSIPVGIIAFICVLLFNFFLSRIISNQTKKEKNTHYFSYCAIISMVIVLGFTLFDYLQFNQFGSKSNFIYIFLKYSQLFIFIFIITFLNRKLVWNNFN